MSMTITEKILAAHAHLPSVHVGDVIVADVDIACIDDIQFRIFCKRLADMGDTIGDPDRMLIVADHYTPPVGLDEAGLVGALARFGRERGIRTITTDGIKHQVMIEQRLARPGALVVATDSHTNTAGAVGAFATALGPTDLAAVAVTGKTWLRVPGTIRFEIDGTLPPYVFAMDVGLTLLAEFGLGFADYKTVEWSGSMIRGLGLNGRMTLCNLTTELGAKNGIIEPDHQTMRWLPARDDGELFKLYSDPDANFAAIYRYAA
jgi:3-isopropylmalate/(R)-2-methylmalate dehydratase large subunit